LKFIENKFTENIFLDVFYACLFLKKKQLASNVTFGVDTAIKETYSP